MKLENDRIWALKSALNFPLWLLFFAAVVAKADSWGTNTPMLMAREEHTATLLSDGRVLVAGGFNSLNGALTNAEIYNPNTQTWSPIPGMHTARYEHTATLLTNGQVLIAAALQEAPVANCSTPSQEPGPLPDL